MVRKGLYKRKGGHGGSRLGSGLPTAYWEKQGGRKEAAIDKGKREREAAAKAASDKAKRTALWLKVAAKPAAAEQQGSGSHTNGEGQQA